MVVSKQYLHFTKALCLMLATLNLFEWACINIRHINEHSFTIIPLFVQVQVSSFYQVCALRTAQKYHQALNSILFVTLCFYHTSICMYLCRVLTFVLQVVMEQICILSFVRYVCYKTVVNDSISRISDYVLKEDYIEQG